MKTRRLWTPVTAMLAASTLALVAGCGSGDSGGSGSGGSGNGAAIDTKAAADYIAPYQAQPSRFPVTEPLSKLPAPGSTVAFLDLGSPIAALMWDYLQPTADILHIKLQRVQTGSDAQSINTALNSVVESHPAAVIDVALDPTLFTPQLEKMKAEGIAFVPASIVNGDQFGYPDSSVLAGKASSLENGKVDASAILTLTKGKAKEFVFYNIPEFPFSNVQQEGFKQQMKAQCPDCNVRVVDIPIAQIGTTAPQSVVSDLQAHPETQAFVGAVDEIQMGLPAAMKVAGLDVPGMGQSPSPLNYQQIAQGTQMATFAVDFHMFMWLAMDQALRGISGQKVDYGSARDLNSSISQIITKDNVPSDPEQGWLAFPDYQQQFTKLWMGQ